MKFKKLILVSIALLQLNIGYTKTNIALIKHDINAKFNPNLSGYYPSIQGKQFNGVNNIILKFIQNNFDNKQTPYSTEVDYKKIFENSKFLSLSIDYSRSNSTERYFNKYYTFDLLKDKEITLSEYLKYKKTSKTNVINKINNFIVPCLSNKTFLDYCSDITIKNLIENKTQVSYADISGFFIKSNNEIGFGLDSSKFTATFIYNLNTKKVYID